MKIAVRMDDITPGMDWEKFNRFYTLLKDKGIYPLLGVVPYNCDDNLNISDAVNEDTFWKEIHRFESEGCVIAMHGYDHIYTTDKGGLFPLNHFSEFAGTGYEEQKKRIKAGKKVLEEKGIHTDMFMAPAHSYDADTLKVLKECGFTKITDGFGLRPYTYRQMTFYPIAFKQSTSLKRKKGVTTFVVHSNTMSEQDFKRWEVLLDNSKNTRWISYKELTDITPVKQNAIAVMAERALAVFKHILVNI